MENSKRTFGERLKQIRKERKMKQGDLATKLKMAEATVRNWEQGRTWPEMNDILRLCTLFECDVDYLIGRIEQKTHDLAFLCSETGLSPDAIKQLVEIKNSPFGGDDLEIISKILSSPKLKDAISSFKDAKWAQDQVDTDAQIVAKKNADQWSRNIAFEELPEKLRYLKAFRFEVTEAASGILNDSIQIDKSITEAQNIIERYKMDILEKEARNEH